MLALAYIVLVMAVVWFGATGCFVLVMHAQDEYGAGTWDFGIEARQTSGGVTKLHSTVKIAGSKR